MSETTTSIETADVLAIDASIIRDSGSAEYGITKAGFVPKPFARLLAEKLALARELLGPDLDLTSGSAIRKLFEVTALEEARTWAAIGSFYDNCFAVTATGEALTRLGEELGVQRPFMRAAGKIKVKLNGDLPDGTEKIEIPRGSRLFTPGGHHVATQETFSLSKDNPEKEVEVWAFYPGSSHNLDPTTADGQGVFTQRIEEWNPLDSKLKPMFEADLMSLLEIKHTEKFQGGEKQWSDVRYRSMILSAPRSIWTVEAIEIAVSVLPGVRQVQVSDGWGGLDLSQSIFGNFNFIERVFASERDLGSPYYFTVLVAPTADAIWEGPDGLRASIESAIEDLRPISIFPRIEEAEQIGVGIQCNLVVKGLPLPTGSVQTVNASSAAKELKRRLLLRVQSYVDGLKFGEQVRTSEVTWALMNEPGVADVQDLRLVRYPPGFEGVNFSDPSSLPDREVLECQENLKLSVNQVPEFIDRDEEIIII
jgi:hypothetical protein